MAELQTSTAVPHAGYLESVERLADGREPGDLYLWPRTPIDDLQGEIQRRIGFDDYQVGESRSRPALIIQQIELLIRDGLLANDFSIIDICCGDAVVLSQIKQAFPRAQVYGVDLLKGELETHERVQFGGVRLFKGFVQDLFRSDVETPFDLVMMLNTYRGWESADLREHERDLPELAEAWFAKNSRYTVLTAKPSQVTHLKGLGFAVQKMGKGEDRSVMVCLSTARLPKVPLGIALRRWLDSTIRSGGYPGLAASVVMRLLRRVRRHTLVRDPLYFLVELPRARLTGRLPAGVLREYWAQLLPVSWRRRRPRRDTTYVFGFLGEFGYEIMNWQGVVRKFAQTLPPSSEIVIAGRRGLEAFYDGATRYIDIADFEPYRESWAAAYFALPLDQDRRRRPPLPRELAFDLQLRNALRSHVLKTTGLPEERVEFVFSSHLASFPSCTFGVDRHFYGGAGRPGQIYGSPALLESNEYRKILPDLTAKPEIEQRLGFELERPYVLVQTRRRQIGPQSGGAIPEQQLIDELARHMTVVVLSFDTGRLLDSGSAPEQSGSAVEFQATSFREQGCLIAHASVCVFPTEGDLGSHTYLPPFIGKDSVVVASQEVFDMPSAPIEFWNEHVFRFGGQVIPWVAESLFGTPEALRDKVDALLGQEVSSGREEQRDLTA